MSVIPAHFEDREFTKGFTIVFANMILRWVLFWMEVATPILVFGYFYYSNEKCWHFVFFAVVLSFIWMGLLYKAVDMFSYMRKCSKVWMEDGFDRAAIHPTKKIPLWMINNNGSYVALAVVFAIGCTSGLFGEVWSSWLHYQLPTKDPIAGFWHFFMIYF